MVTAAAAGRLHQADASPPPILPRSTLISTIQVMQLMHVHIYSIHVLWYITKPNPHHAYLSTTQPIYSGLLPALPSLPLSLPSLLHSLLPTLHADSAEAPFSLACACAGGAYVAQLSSSDRGGRGRVVDIVVAVGAGAGVGACAVVGGEGIEHWG